MQNKRLPLVSIITPSYNQARFIEATILSVMEQDYPNIEHIVIDGASSDNTVEILTSYENKYNLQWISEADDGQSEAINKGFARASGGIIGWLNSDDIYAPGAIRAVVDSFMSIPAVGWVYGDSEFINEKGDWLRAWKAREFDLSVLITEGQFMAQPTVFFRTDLIQRIGFLDNSLHYAMDTDLFTRMGVESPGLYIPTILAKRRIHGEAKTSRNLAGFAKDRLKLLDKLFTRTDLSQNIKRLKGPAYANAFFFAACRYLASQEYGQARSYCLKCFIDRPTNQRFTTIKTMLIFLQTFLQLHFYVPGLHKYHTKRQNQ